MPASILGPTEENILHLASALREGEVVALPTETVYGLAGAALNETAVHKIFTIKGRPLIDPLIVHILDLEQAKFLAFVSEHAERLMDHFWPGALTIVLPKRVVVPSLVTAGQPTVALRSPAHPSMRAVLKVSGLALAVPSANPFGQISPSLASHVRSSIGCKMKYILDGGPASIGLESTIVSLLPEETPCLLRLGPISKEDIEAVLGTPLAVKTKGQGDSDAQVAPGQMTKHYSPRTPCRLLEDLEACQVPENQRLARVFFKKPKKPRQDKISDFWLTESGDLAEAARVLYALMQRLDQQQFDLILFQYVPSVGIGQAINDRLVRAAAD